MSARKKTHPSNGHAVPRRRRGPAKARASNQGAPADAISGLISTLVAGAESFARKLGHDGQQHLLHAASEYISGFLNSEPARDIKSLIRFWHSGAGADEFGKDATLVEFLRPLFQFLYSTYFRVDVSGSRAIPRRGPAILVANHAGTLPYDGAMVHLAVYNELAGQREVRFLVEDFVYHLPVLGTFIERIGGVRACHENAEALLAAGHLIVVFPEGVKGIGKTYEDRYKLERFGRGGFIRLALHTGVPIIPVAIIGSEETHPIIWKSESLGRRVGLPFVPFTPTFPWLGPLGLVPLPSKWKIMFGRVHRFDRFKPHDAENKKLVQAHADEIRGEIQAMLDDALSRRTNVWK
jgi:1-acyl-sn-glycerol-3-phosphate acyltransferase